MSEEKTETEGAEAAEAAEATESEDKGATTQSPVNPLSRPTAATLRPGFRNPANSRSKAQKKRRKKKKR